MSGSSAPGGPGSPWPRRPRARVSRRRSTGEAAASAASRGRSTWSVIESTWVAHPGHQSGRPRVHRRAAPWQHARGTAAPRGRDRRNLLRVPVPAGQRPDQERRTSPGPARRRVRTGVAAPQRCRRVGRGLWIVDRYGWAFHDRFFRPYTEKLWGVPASQVDERLARVITGSANDTSSDGSWTRLAKRLRPAPSDRGRKGTFTYPRPRHRRDLRSARRPCGGCGRHDPHRRPGLRGRPRGRPGRRCRHPRGRRRATPRPRGRSRPVPVLLELTGGALGSNPPRTRATIVVYVEVAAEPAFDELWRFLFDPGPRRRPGRQPLALDLRGEDRWPPAGLRGLVRPR